MNFGSFMEEATPSVSFFEPKFEPHFSHGNNAHVGRMFSFSPFGFKLCDVFFGPSVDGGWKLAPKISTDFHRAVQILCKIVDWVISLHNLAF